MWRMISLPRRRRARTTTPARLTTAALMGTAATVATLVATDIIPVPSWALDGIDVSSHQHPAGSAIDWQTVADSGQKFVFVKATEGTGYTNPYFATDSFKAEDAGMVPGSYHYARPGTTDPRAEARHYAAVLATGPQPSLPPALDLEEHGGLGPVELQNWVREWVDEIKTLTGRDPIIYTYYSFWIQRMANTTEFSEYPLWLAYYSNSLPNQIPGGWDEVTFWQYTGSGSVEGVQTDVDMNTYYGNDAQLQALAGHMPEDTAAGGTAEKLQPMKETVRTEAQVANTIEQVTGMDVPLPSDFFMLLLGVIGGRLPADVLLTQGAAQLEAAAGEWADGQKKSTGNSIAGTSSANDGTHPTGTVDALNTGFRMAYAIAQAIEEYNASGKQLTVDDVNAMTSGGNVATIGQLLKLLQQYGNSQKNSSSSSSSALQGSQTSQAPQIQSRSAGTASASTAGIAAATSATSSTPVQ